MAEKPVILRAKYAYKPANNDELKLEKGDLITLTQKEEGGWWEGTLNGRTGWFPSNYVVEHNPSPPTSSVLMSPEEANSSSSSVNCSPAKNSNGQQQLSTISASSSSHSSLVDVPTKRSPLDERAHSANMTSPSSRSGVTTEEQIQYRRMILTDLIDSETVHISELQSTWDNVLQHLPKAGILTPTEYKILVGNLTEIIQVLTTCILNPLKSEQCKPVIEQRIGKIFLDNAPKVEAAHKTYCSNHPKAVQIIEKHKEQLGIFVEGRGNCKPPGILHLLTVLSQAFRRLEKYPLILLELERQIEEFHKDRGDLQRSIEYYKELDKACIDLRKQKEMELEVLSGAIIGWEGSDITQLGNIVHMNLVHLGQNNEPRYFVLFTNTLLILSYDLEKSSLTYEGKIPVSGITLTQLTDKDRYKHMSNGFEIAGPMIDPIAVNCPSKQAKEAWMHHINRILRTNRFPSFGNSPQQVRDHRTCSSISLNKTSSLAQIVTPTSTSSTVCFELSNSKERNNEERHIPSKTPPYVVLVDYFGKLNKRSRIFLYANKEINEAPLGDPIRLRNEAGTAKSISTRPEVDVENIFPVTKDRDLQFSQPDTYRGLNRLKKVKSVDAVANSQTRSRKIRDSFFRIRRRSLPSRIKLNSISQHPADFKIPQVSKIRKHVKAKERHKKRGRFTRQDAFDFDDGEIEFISDENDNFQRVHLNVPNNSNNHYVMHLRAPEDNI